MSSATWTPDALKSSAIRLSGTCWRIVEAQHRYSTMKIVDTIEDQERLERLIEESKPPVADECAGLHFLLFTPFRYSASNPYGSRFRRPYAAHGVFYASSDTDAAIAEVAFYRTLFFAESPATPWPTNPSEYTAFAVEYRTRRAIDITKGPLASHAGLYHLANYATSQDFADDVRIANLDVIKYRSMRDPRHRDNFAILACGAFAKKEPVGYRTWRLHLDANGARAVCESPHHTLSFDREAFATDPRLRGLVWDR